MSEWVVTLDVTIEASSRKEAFSKVEALMKNAKSYCLYDAEEATTDVGRGEWLRPSGLAEYEVGDDSRRD